MRRTVWVVLGLAACAGESEVTEERPEEPVERAAPEIVASGVVSTDERNQTFPAIDPQTGDLWYSEYSDSFDDQVLMRAPAAEGHWGAPEVVPFSGEWGDRAPRFSPDGAHLYFTSNRPVGSGGGDMNIWVVERTADGWGDPAPAADLNSSAPDMHASVSETGVWFASRRDGGRGRSDLYRRGADGALAHLGPELNDELSQPDLWVSPDESWMLLAVTDRPDGFGGDDLYVVRRTDGRWGAPVNLGSDINSEEYEYGPWVDSSGGYLYFTSHRAGPSHIYRVPLSALERGGER